MGLIGLMGLMGPIGLIGLIKLIGLYPFCTSAITLSQFPPHNFSMSVVV